MNGLAEAAGRVHGVPGLVYVAEHSDAPRPEGGGASWGWSWTYATGRPDPVTLAASRAVFRAGVRAGVGTTPHQRNPNDPLQPHLLGDDHLHDFAGAAKDALNARVGVGAADGVLLHVAIASE